MEDIILKDLSQQSLTDAEKRKLEFWLGANPKNQKVYAQLKLSMIYPNHQKQEEIKESTWMELKGRLSPQQVKLPIRKNRWWQWFQVAAMLIIVGAAFFVIFNEYSNKTSTNQVVVKKVIEKVSLPGQRITAELPDGTLVKLNAGSRITFPETFSEEKRQVVLKGEAFFHVVQDPERPFIIKTNEFNVRASDASLNVNTIEVTRKCGVAVETGNVVVNDLDQAEIYRVSTAEKLLIDDGRFEKSEIEYPGFYFGWTDQMMVFRNHTLTESLKKVQRWYGVEIELEKELKSKKKYTAKYKRPELNKVLTGLAHAYNFNYSIDGKIITIK